MRKTLLLAAAALVVVGAPALAFHDDGVAHCNGCHTMHNSQNGNSMNFLADGSPNPAAGPPGWNDLLLYQNKTDVCLDCHDGNDGYHVWSADPLAPSSNAERGGGDFVFLEAPNINDAHGGAGSPVEGYASGHSVISAMHGTVADPALATSPGGTYSSTNMHCTSCHDPHGTQAYRILYQDGQSSENVNFTNGIAAIGISVFAGAETNSFHNAYQSGYSAWCGTCHGAFHANSGQLVHPSGEPMNDTATQYNSYEGTENCIDIPPSGTVPCGDGLIADAYLAMVPFEDVNNTSITATNGADGSTSYVACMTCHRAHATSAMDAGRWDFNITGLAEDGHESTSYPIPDPYNNMYQRSLCNKCHGQDAYDLKVDFTP